MQVNARAAITHQAGAVRNSTTAEMRIVSPATRATPRRITTTGSVRHATAQTSGAEHHNRTMG